MSYLGLVCIILLTGKTSAVVAGITTTVRKAFSVLLSFIVFGKNFSPFYALGGVTVFGGIAVHQSAKHVAKRKEKRREEQLRAQQQQSQQTQLPVEVSVTIVPPEVHESTDINTTNTEHSKTTEQTTLHSESESTTTTSTSTTTTTTRAAAPFSIDDDESATNITTPVEEKGKRRRKVADDKGE